MRYVGATGQMQRPGQGRYRRGVGDDRSLGVGEGGGAVDVVVACCEPRTKAIAQMSHRCVHMLVGGVELGAAC